MNDGWWGDRAFRKTAEFMWPDDYRAAVSCSRVKGQAAARERIERRHEGFAAWRGLVRVHDEIDRVLRELGKS